MSKWMSLLVVLSLSVLSCSEDPAPPKPSPRANPAENPFPPGYEKADSSGDFTTRKMLLNIGVNLQRENAAQFLLKSRALRDSLKRTCGRVDPSNWSASAQSWREAMLAYHRLETLPMGPLIENKNDLQTKIYSWPFVNPCGIDLQVEAGSQGKTADPAALPINVRGLGALEYLLYESSLKTSCNTRAYPNLRVWSEKPSEEKLKDRCLFAQALAEDVVVQAEIVDRGWDTQKGNYSYTLTNGSKYKNMDDAVTEYVHGLFSIEKLKDQRLARPLGLHKSCSNDDKKCPESVEHIWSGLSLDALAAQMEAFQEAFWGAKNPEIKAFGLDDDLIQAGHPEAVDQMRQAFLRGQQMLALVQAQGPLRQQIENMSPEACRASTYQNPQVPACALYREIREISTLLKTDVLVILSLRAPPGYQGDND